METRNITVTLPNNDGTLLMSQTYSKEKYKVAADAALEAINFAEDHGYRLYYVGDDAIGTATYPYPKDPIQKTAASYIPGQERN